jgi:hypothetical protein
VQIGSPSTLSWTTTNANTFVINNGVGSVTPVAAGSKSVSPILTTTYVGTATGAGGSVTCAAQVTITLLPPPSVSCTLIANPTSIENGGSSNLSWTTSGATRFTINNHIGSVTPVAAGSTTVSPTTTTTYTGTASGPGGSINCSATVTVTNTPPPPPPAPTCTLVANPNSITQGGSSSLQWTTTNANSFSIDNGVGSVSPVSGGSTTVSPTNTTTYTGTATGANGQTVTCQGTVTVTTPGGNPTPACFLNANPTSINQGGSATLTWGGTNIQSVSINNGIGNQNVNGSTNVSPSNTTTYTGNFVSTTGQTITCSATVNVVPPGIIYGGGGGGGGGGVSGQFISYQFQPQAPAAAYVSLSQIPYTGLDLGPVGTIVYWIALIVFCLAAAYLMLFKVVPFVYHGLQKFGLDLSYMINEPASHLATAGHAAAVSAPVTYATAHSAPVAPSVPAMSSASARNVMTSSAAYSTEEGFRSFAHGNTLTIDDIVKGLAREAGVPANAPAVAAYTAAAQAEAAHGNVVAMAPRSISAASPAQEMQNAPVIGTDVRDFVAALLQGDRSTVFSTLRQIVREGGDAETFMTQVVCALDDAYRARLDGTKVHPEIAQLTPNCATPFLERLNNALTNAVDSSYSPGISGSKLALTRALAVIEG